MSGNRDYVPHNSASFDRWFKNLKEYIAERLGGTEPAWGHIIPKDRNALNDAYADWYTRYEPTLRPHTQAEAAVRNHAREQAEKVIRPFVMRYLRSEPVNSGDRLTMGIPNHDTIRTDHTVVTEEVEFSLGIRGTQQIDVEFKVLDAINKTKPEGYDGALIVWDLLDTLPVRPENLIRHTMAGGTPFTIEFDASERGKKVYVALAWQNAQGILGKWSEVQWTLVP